MHFGHDSLGHRHRCERCFSGVTVSSTMNQSRRRGPSMEAVRTTGTGILFIVIIMTPTTYNHSFRPLTRSNIKMAHITSASASPHLLTGDGDELGLVQHGRLRQRKVSKPSRPFVVWISRVD